MTDAEPEPSDYEPVVVAAMRLWLRQDADATITRRRIERLLTAWRAAAHLSPRTIHDLLVAYFAPDEIAALGISEGNVRRITERAPRE